MHMRQSYTTLAFTAIAIIISCFAPNVDEKMTGQVAATLHTRKDEHTVGEGI